MSLKRIKRASVMNFSQGFIYEYGRVIIIDFIRIELKGIAKQ